MRALPVVAFILAGFLVIVLACLMAFDVSINASFTPDSVASGGFIVLNPHL